MRDVVELHLDPLPEAAVGDVQQSTAVRDQLERGFVALNTDQRTCVVLHLYLGLSLEETADIVGVPRGPSPRSLRKGLVPFGVAQTSFPVATSKAMMNSLSPRNPIV